MVYAVLSQLSEFIQFDKYCIDNVVFKMHYIATVLILVASSILVSSTQFFGDDIECQSNMLFETFCWMQTTFSVVDAFNMTLGIQVPYPGIDTYIEGEKRRVYHKYYQWVTFVLFGQSILFYAPRYLWKIWEGGRLGSLVQNLDEPVIKEEKKEESIDLLVEYFKSKLRNHNIYFGRFVFCEALNCINIISQMYLTDAFLGGTFWTYGLDVYRYYTTNDISVDPKVVVFPRRTKCTFYQYGPSSTIIKKDTDCLLPMNNLNDKIYLFLWFWFVFLGILTAFALLYRLLIILIKPLRNIKLQWRAQFCDFNHLNVVLKNIKIGDWFILHLLADNLDASNFSEFIKRYSECLQLEDQSNNNDEKNSTINYNQDINGYKLTDKSGVQTHMTKNPNIFRIN